MRFSPVEAMTARTFAARWRWWARSCAAARRSRSSTARALPHLTRVGVYSASYARLRHSPSLPRLLRAPAARRPAELIARAVGRSHAPVRERGDGAVQEGVPGDGGGAGREAARHDGAEVRARRRQAQRPRAGGTHGAPPHLLRDARQLLVRRLLQARRDPLCLGAAHATRWAGDRPVAAARLGALQRR